MATELRAERATRRMTIDDLASATILARGTTLRVLNDPRTIDGTQLALPSEVLGVDPVAVLQRAQLRVASQ
ncbi:hypothetical protein [Terrabacter sp. NPDC000476]|uniref:hypothetical protein n=1 Tax=Terrabacter sp. NPDC000476 TaxID=3154258 RepID=UPI0033310E01